MERKFKPKKIKKRYFIAFSLPLELKRQLNSISRIFEKEGRNFRFVDMEQMHMTIKYLGENISDFSLNKIIEILNVISNNYKTLDLTVSSLKFGFAHQPIPNLLFFNVDSTSEINTMYKDISSKLKKLDLSDIESSTYMKKDIYHITVARLKHQDNRAYARKIRTIIYNYNFSPIPFRVNEFFIIKSELNNKSPKYTYLKKFNLQNEN